MSANTVYVLYKVVNSESDTEDPCFNAFPLKLGGGNRPTLALVKQQCAALYGMSHLGPEGYHWRVFVEDKQGPSEGGGSSSGSGGTAFSWWDIQDENASLPVKEAPQSRLNKIFGPPKVDHSDPATKAAKGAFKGAFKAMSQAVGVDDSATSSGPLVKIVAFKLLDLVRMHDDFNAKHKGGAPPAIPQQQQSQSEYKAPKTPSAPTRQQPTQPTPATGARRPQQQPQQQRSHAASAPPQRAPQQQQQQQRAPQQQHQQQPRRQQQQPAAEASLMDFGSTSSAPRSSNAGGGRIHHASSMPSMHTQQPPPPANETRAERLKREYAEKHASAQRVWDDIDQRWVEVEQKSPSAALGTNSRSSSFGAGIDQPTKKKEVGISIDESLANAANKSAQVQAAVNKRANEMKESQAKALQEVREREFKKKQEEAEEDAVRKRLEPQIKAWSEEHGKKKQLRALLASLHTILWPEAHWKQVTIGDLLDAKKVKLNFHKASRVVHPDKTHHLDAEKRFLAKRIFDALSQAKTEFDANEK